MRAALLLFLTFVGGCAGCLRDTSYKCSTNDQCGAGGQCESVGYCSFADSDCGRRFGPSAGSYANQCVGGQMGSDSGVGSDGSGSGSDGSGSDSTTDPCPSDFTTLSGGATGVRYKLIATADNWVNQKSACANIVSMHTWLAYPNGPGPGELQAMDALAGSNNVYWVGISDLQTAGTWLNVMNMTQSYLPWEGGAPSNNPNNQCVEALTQNTTITNDTCTKTFPAICACQ